MDEQVMGPANVITQRALAPVPTVAERPAPRWREAVGAAALLSVVETVRAQETAASA
ncbi:hypothetical protein [Actinomycetospora sp. NBRC 106378]|jgi:hypothetical protein|uniref:hypothetical protein n=1 Tax=Actinomycetospora sp. NBRC 106378 TaxID=3032208 RepID=UPI0024A603C6|nr:hypothetical protein [Actinomycetospora sp. NBRC 106378]GLZ51076.1 hypothetical protein Acsp07_06930 [Actinomycetospora sp. NBRC 106378]